MSSNANIDYFVGEIRATIERTRAESDITYAEAIGCLEIISLDLYREMREKIDND